VSNEIETKEAFGLIGEPDPGPQIVEEIGFNMFLLDNGQVTIDGFVVPYVTVDRYEGKDSEANEYTYWPTIDNRMTFPVKDRENLSQLINFGATLAAVAAGYTAFGENLRPHDPAFNTYIHGVGSRFNNFKVKEFLAKQGGSLFGASADKEYNKVN
jgi:hypothetical protein